VAGPVIQATGRSEFVDGLGSGDFVSGYSYHMSVRTRLPDHTKQTKFQSQRPNDVETPVPLSQRPYAMLKAPVPSITVVKQH
jgi:hypothetical protein